MSIHSRTKPTGETEPTVTRKRPTGAPPTPQGQPSDKAENRLGEVSMNFEKQDRKVVPIARI